MEFREFIRGILLPTDGLVTVGMDFEVGHSRSGIIIGFASADNSLQGILILGHDKKRFIFILDRHGMGQLMDLDRIQAYRDETGKSALDYEDIWAEAYEVHKKNKPAD